MALLLMIIIFLLMHNIDKASGFSFDWLVISQNSILSVILLAVPACVSSVFWGRKVGGR